MQNRKYYEAYWSQYNDLVTLNEFRKMLGGLGEVQARRLLQNKTVKSFKIRGEYSDAVQAYNRVKRVDCKRFFHIPPNWGQRTVFIYA